MRWFVLFLAFVACEEPLEGERLVAAKADLTVRQLVAGLNAKNKDALSQLLVITSTTGGAPRRLRPNELPSVVFPDPPYEMLGAGAPGTMKLKDGKGRIRIVKLLVRGEQLRVLASRVPLSEHLSRESGQALPMVPDQPTVIEFVLPQ